MNDELQGKLIEWMDLFQQAVAKYSSDAADLGLFYAQVGAAQNSIVPLLFTAVVLLITYQGYRAVKFGYRITQAPYHYEGDDEQLTKLSELRRRDGEVPFFMGGGFVVVLGSVVAIISFSETFNLYAWIGLFKPEIWLVHVAVNSI